MIDSAFVYILSIPLYLGLLIAYLVRKKNIRSIFFNTLFYFYIIAVIGVTLFPLPIESEMIKWEKEHADSENNFIPFTFLPDALAPFTVPADAHPHYFDYAVFIALRQVGGNILLGVPFGFLAPLIWKKRNTWWKVLVAGFYFSLAIEMTQFIISSILGFTYRLTDIDDIILNCSGCLIGYAFYKLSLPIIRKFHDFTKNVTRFRPS